jgi:hypothetical protein
MNKRLSNISNINKQKVKSLLSKQATINIGNKKLVIKKARNTVRVFFAIYG